MIDLALTAISWLFLAAGAVFFLVGAVGMLRFPDVYTRMHAASVSESVGGGLLLIGMMIEAGPTLITVKLAITLGLIVFSVPVAAHALAQAAMHEGVEPVLSTRETLRAPRRRRGDARPESGAGAGEAEP